MENLLRQKLTVVIPTKNAQAKVENCLKSVSWADEIIIIDGGSSDQTIEICQQYTTKIYSETYQGYFSKIRNLGTEKASGDWVLQLDADEIVSEKLKEEIIKILANPQAPFAAYKFKRKNYFFGKPVYHGGWYHDSLHFLKKGKAHYEGELHERLVVNGSIGKIEAEVEHFPFDSIEQFIARQNNYTTRTAKEIFNSRGRLSQKDILFNLRIKPLKLFWKSYVKKRGYKEGRLGLILSILFAWVHFTTYAKYWELIKRRDEG